MAKAAKTEADGGGAYAAIKAQVGPRAEKAKAEKRKFLDNIREAYSFVMPDETRPGESSTQSKPDAAADNFSSLGEEVLVDFASDMADTFIPEHTPWAGVEVGKLVPEEFEEDAKAAAKKDTETTFAAINASNFHEAGKQAFKDLGVSAFGMAIDDPGAGEPFRCRVIPISELLILRDATGCIGTRIWERDLNCLDIVELFPDIKPLPLVVRRAIEGKKHHEKFVVRQGCYRDYSVRAETAWILFIQIAGDIVRSVRKVGVGSANVLVGRWDPSPKYAWGRGPAIKAIPDFRELDETQYLKLKGLARQVDPPLRYDDDQVMNLDGGLPNGVAIPSMKGSTIDVIESKHGMEAALYAVADVEQRVRRHFYQDGPVQKGKTPPTAAQWADESLQKQRRLGTPAAPLWGEFLAEAYMRFRWLMVQRGLLKEEIRVGGQVFPVRPINPLKRAANQQKAIATERVLGSIAATFGPEKLGAIVDVGETSHNLVELWDATGIKLRSKEEINKTLEENMQAMMAQQAVQTAAPLMKGK